MQSREIKQTYLKYIETVVFNQENRYNIGQVLFPGECYGKRTCLFSTTKVLFVSVEMMDY